MVETIVEQAGIYAHYATSGTAALEILKGNRCECLFTDLNMPGMNGYELSKRARELVPDLKIVLITAEASEQFFLSAASLGILSVFNKPASVHQVLKIVQSVTPPYPAVVK